MSTEALDRCSIRIARCRPHPSQTHSSKDQPRLPMRSTHRSTSTGSQVLSRIQRRSCRCRYRDVSVRVELYASRSMQPGTASMQVSVHVGLWVKVQGQRVSASEYGQRQATAVVKVSFISLCVVLKAHLPACTCVVVATPVLCVRVFHKVLSFRVGASVHKWDAACTGMA